MLSKTALHALKAVVALTDLAENEYWGATKLADHIGAPQNYLGKLLQTLAQEGVVVSQKGLGGGFRLARPPETIRLFDVVEPIDHVSRWGNCLMGHDRCSDKNPCPLHQQWSVVRDVYFKMLTEFSVADIAQGTNGRKRG